MCCTSGEASSSGVTSRAGSRSTGSPMVTISRTLTAPTLPPARAKSSLRLGAELVRADVRLQAPLESPLVTLGGGLRRCVIDCRTSTPQRHRRCGPTVLSEVAQPRILVHEVATPVEATRVLVLEVVCGRFDGAVAVRPGRRLPLRDDRVEEVRRLRRFEV